MKKQGEKIKNFDQKKWRRYSRDVLLKGCEMKFSQNEELMRHLLNTRDILAEASPTDCYWGIGRSLWDPRSAQEETWRGDNVMGGILMQLKRQFGAMQGEVTEMKEIKVCNCSLSQFL